MINQSIWKEKNTILYFLGTTCSKLSDKLYIFAIPWLIYEITESATNMGIMFLLQTIPFVFVSPIAGVLADNFSRKSLLVISAVLQGILISLIPILYSLQILQIWHIYILGFCIACLGAVFSVTNATVIPQIFNKDILIKINSTYQFVDTSSVLFGSILAGLLIGSFGVHNVLFLISFLYIPISASMMLLSFLIVNEKSSTVEKSIVQLKEGAKFLFTNPILGPFTFLVLIVNIANGSLLSMLVYFSRDKLLLTSEEVGWIYAGAAVVQFIAIMLVNHLGNKMNQIKLMLISLIISGLGIIFVSLSWSWQTLLLAVAIQSAPVIIFNVLFKTIRQKLVPIDVFGRVNGLIMMIGLGTLPLAGLFTGILADFVDIRFIFFILGVFSLITPLMFTKLIKINIEVEENNILV